MISRNFYKTLYVAIVIFAIYDSMFLNSIFTFEANLRTVLYLMLFVICFVKYRFRYIRLNIWFQFFFIYLIFKGFIHLGEYGEYKNLGLNYFIKNVFQILIIYCFFHYSLLVKERIESLFKIIINAVAVWCFLNFFFFFVDVPIWGVWRNVWFGRISFGYPTTDVVIISFAYALLLFKQTGFNNLIKTVYIILYFSSIIAQSSGTGILLLFCITTIFIGYSIIQKRLSLYKLFKIICVILLSGYILTYAITAFSKFDRAMLQDITIVLTNKIYALTGNKEMMTIDTMEYREDVEKKSLKKLRSTFDKLFGIGYARCDYLKGGYAHSDKYVMIESQYGINRFAIGHLGNILFLLAIYSPLINIMKKRNYKDKFLILTMFLIYALSCFTVTPFSTFSLQVILAIILAYENEIRTYNISAKLKNNQ